MLRKMLMYFFFSTYYLLQLLESEKLCIKIVWSREESTAQDYELRNNS